MLKIDHIYEDEDLIILDKPSGILSIPDRFNPEKPNLQSYLNQKTGSIYTVHRLDKDTSGVICFAKTEQAHQALSLQFEHRTIEKHYLAIVDGRLAQEFATIDFPIARDPNRAGRMIINRKGKPSLTEYERLELFKSFTYLRAKILTGRTHQIRVHFAAIGHPLVIDPLYGKRTEFYLSEIKRKRYNLAKEQESERPLVNRLTLHASELKLNHPTNGQSLSFEAKQPKAIKALLNQLRKWNK